MCVFLVVFVFGCETLIMSISGFKNTAEGIVIRPVDSSLVIGEGIRPILKIKLRRILE